MCSSPGICATVQKQDLPLFPRGKTGGSVATIHGVKSRRDGERDCESVLICALISPARLLATTTAFIIPDIFPVLFLSFRSGPRFAGSGCTTAPAASRRSSEPLCPGTQCLGQDLLPCLRHHNLFVYHSPPASLVPEVLMCPSDADAMLLTETCVTLRLPTPRLHNDQEILGKEDSILPARVAASTHADLTR